MQIKWGKQLPGPIGLRLPSDPADGIEHETAEQGQVFGGAELEDQPQILVHKPQPAVSLAAVQIKGLVAQPRLGAWIGTVVAGQDLDQGRLARAVLPDQGVDLPITDLQADVVKGFGPRKGLR